MIKFIPSRLLQRQGCRHFVTIRTSMPLSRHDMHRTGISALLYYSYRRASTGLALAVFSDCQVTVNMAMINAIRADSMKISAPSLT